jgi:hypothetical protein
MGYSAYHLKEKIERELRVQVDLSNWMLKTDF